MFRSKRSISQGPITVDTVLKLASRLDSPAATTLAAELTALRGQPIRLDGGDVTFAGALALQLLVSAARQWRDDGLAFRIGSASAALRRACSSLGISCSEIGAEPEAEAAA